MTNSEKEQKFLILDKFHNGKCNFCRGKIERIRRIKEEYSWQSLTIDVENCIRNCNICQQTETCYKILQRPILISEISRTPFEEINIDILEIPSRRHVLTIRDGLTKCSQAYTLNIHIQ